MIHVKQTLLYTLTLRVRALTIKETPVSRPDKVGCESFSGYLRSKDHLCHALQYGCELKATLPLETNMLKQKSTEKWEEKCIILGIVNK